MPDLAAEGFPTCPAGCFVFQKAPVASVPMKSPALPNLANCTILTIVLLTISGCGWVTKSHHHRVGAPPPMVAPAPSGTPAPVVPLPPGVTPTPPPFPAKDKKFLNTAARIVNYERRLGSLARQYGNSDDARNLGGLMETEMALAEERLKALTVSKKQQIDSGAGWGHGGLEQLSSLKGGDFDRRFCEEVKASSPEGYGVFDQAFREVVDPDIKDFAKNWYPVLRNYPREALKLEKQLDKKKK
jgi:Domain of unknown function (DUF4142)